MAASFSLTQNGAIPKYSAEGLKRVSGLGLTATPTATSNPTTASTQNIPLINQGTNKGIIEPPKATTPLKKSTTTNADGTSTTHEYHAEATPAATKGTTTTTPPASTVTPPTTPPASPITTPPPTTTFAGATTGLMNQGGSEYNKSIQGAQQGLMETAQNLGTSGPAYDEYQNAVKDAEKMRGLISGQTQGIKNQTQSMSSMTGELQVNQERNADLLSAAEQRVARAAAALGYGIQGQGQQQSGFNQAGQLGTTGQSLAQGALGTAAGLAAPQLAGIGNVPFNPLTQGQGEMIGGAGGYAKLGQFEAQKATASQQYQQTEQYKSAHQQAQNLQSQLGDLISTFGLNPSDINMANAGIQKIAANVSDPKYKILSNYLADVASRYSQILTPAGGSSTDTTRAVATGMLDGIASGKSIIEVMNALDNQAQAVIAGVNTANTGTPSGSSTGGFAEAW
jgi:hypothetical protein